MDQYAPSHSLIGATVDVVMCVCVCAELGPFKWGVGKVIANAAIPPVIVPFYHMGMEHVSRCACACVCACVCLCACVWMFGWVCECVSVCDALHFTDCVWCR